MKLIKFFTEFGATKSSSTDTIKRIILVNKISMVFIIAAVPFMLSIQFIGLLKLSLFVPFIMCFLISTPFLNYRGYFLIAKLNLFLTILASVYFFAGTLGAFSGIQYVYLALIGFGFGIFDNSERKLKYTFSLLPIFCFFSLYFSNHWFFFSIDLTKAALMPVYITSISLIFIIIWLTILFFDQSSEIHKQNLKDVLLTYQLSEREGEVFLHILNGKTNKFISENLFIEEGTVKNHLTNIYKKLSVKSRNELMAKFTG